MTPAAVFLLSALLAWFAIDRLADVLNLHALPSEPPREAGEIYDAQEYRRLLDYTRADTQLDVVASSVELAVLIAFWLAGGFGWLDALVRSLASGEATRGLLFIGALFLGGRVVSLPFDVWSTFGIEARFGFNRTTFATFVADQLKGLVLTALLGSVFVSALIVFFSRAGGQAWLLAWAFAGVTFLLLAYVAPSLILPLFNKFTPLPDGDLRRAIVDMADAQKFPLAGIFTMDGSKRSTKSNAFFTGFGRLKKIALFDTLIARHSTGEIVAVLAHEIGHFKLRHIHTRMVLSLLTTGLFLFVASWFIHSRALFDAFGVREMSVYAGLGLFAIFYEPLARVIGLFSGALSRRHEYKADRFAAQVTGSQPLVTALKKLARDNLVNLTPHPLFVALHHSHPPLLRRIAALEGRGGWSISRKGVAGF
jgi:STE24 endopeptidase